MEQKTDIPMVPYLDFHWAADLVPYLAQTTEQMTAPSMAQMTGGHLV